jgi:glycosyltransferase involved in cell wall biosynthesis
MRLLFDHQIFEQQRWGGISRYFVDLLRGLPPHAEVRLALARARSEYLRELGPLAAGVTRSGFPEDFLGGLAVPGARRLRGVAKRLYPPLDAYRVNRARAVAALRRGDFDLFHPTYYDPYFLEPLGARPFVLTVHDLTHEVYPECFPLGDVTGRRKLELARRARRIIAISEHTRLDLIRLLGVEAGRIDVVLHGFEPPAPGPQAAPVGLPERFVLFTGQRGEYKNWAFAVRAMAPVLESLDLPLVCTGGPFSKGEQAYLAGLGLTGRVRHVPVDEAGLRACYARASALIFPSLYEGFGFPVLEAFAAGCPAVLARASSLPEVGGEAALYFEPKDADGLRTALRSALTDAPLRRSLIERGRDRLAQFTLERSRTATLACYRRALDVEHGESS